jgi:predicted nucleotidyltransferase
MIARNPDSDNLTNTDYEVRTSTRALLRIDVGPVGAYKGDSLVDLFTTCSRNAGS